MFRNIRTIGRFSRWWPAWARIAATRALSLSSGPLERLSRLLALRPRHAVFDMVVDQAHGLHEGVDGGGADEFPAILLERLRQRGRLRRGRGGRARRSRRQRVAPEEGGERSLPLHELLRAP